MKQLRSRAFAHKKILLLLFTFSLLDALTLIGQAYIFVYIVDQAFLKDVSFNSLIPSFSVLLVILVARTCCIYLSRRYAIKLGKRAKAEIREELIRKYANNPLQVSLSGQTGKKASIAMDAIDEVDKYFTFYIPQVIKTSSTLFIILIMVFTQHISSGILMIITAPFFPIYMIVIGLKTQKKADVQMEKMMELSGHFLDTLQGLTTLKIMGKSKKQTKVIQQKSFEFRDVTMKVLKTAFSSSLALEFISMLSVGLIAFELGLRLVVFNNITFFSSFFILILAPDFYLSLRDLGSAFHAGRGSIGAVNKITEELGHVDHDVKWGTNKLISTRPPEVHLNQVNFSYLNGPFSLKNISIKIEPLQKVAVIGPNGSGKTTLLRLISGIIDPSSGSIRLNQQLRHDINEKTWFDKISYISQSPFLYSGTIRENICLGTNGIVSDEEMMEVLQKTGLAKMIKSLKEGLDTHIGEGGRGLSGGEKQRIALARAFVKKPLFILFDEPTTGLDLYTEQVLQDSIKELSKHASMITVAHRIYTIKNADQIVYMDKGEIIASGNHSELMMNFPLYRDMMAIQQGVDFK
jgi:ATP-binding cassette subfamily C protein CydD